MSPQTEGDLEQAPPAPGRVGNVSEECSSLRAGPNQLLRSSVALDGSSSQEEGESEDEGDEGEQEEGDSDSGEDVPGLGALDNVPGRGSSSGSEVSSSTADSSSEDSSATASVQVTPEEGTGSGTGSGTYVRLRNQHAEAHAKRRKNKNIRKIRPLPESAHAAESGEAEILSPAVEEGLPEPPTEEEGDRVARAARNAQTRTQRAYFGTIVEVDCRSKNSCVISVAAQVGQRDDRYVFYDVTNHLRDLPVGAAVSFNRANSPTVVNLNRNRGKAEKVLKLQALSGRQLSLLYKLPDLWKWAALNGRLVKKRVSNSSQWGVSPSMRPKDFVPLIGKFPRTSTGLDIQVGAVPAGKGQPAKALVCKTDEANFLNMPRVVPRSFTEHYDTEYLQGAAAKNNLTIVSIGGDCTSDLPSKVLLESRLCDGSLQFNQVLALMATHARAAVEGTLTHARSNHLQEVLRILDAGVGKIVVIVSTPHIPSEVWKKCLDNYFTKSQAGIVIHQVALLTEFDARAVKQRIPLACFDLGPTLALDPGKDSTEGFLICTYPMPWERDNSRKGAFLDRGNLRHGFWLLSQRGCERSANTLTLPPCYYDDKFGHGVQVKMATTATTTDYGLVARVLVRFASRDSLKCRPLLDRLLQDAPIPLFQYSNRGFFADVAGLTSLMIQPVHGAVSGAARDQQDEVLDQLCQALKATTLFLAMPADDFYANDGRTVSIQTKKGTPHNPSFLNALFSPKTGSDKGQRPPVDDSTLLMAVTPTLFRIRVGEDATTAPRNSKTLEIRLRKYAAYSQQNPRLDTRTGGPVVAMHSSVATGPPPQVTFFGRRRWLNGVTPWKGAGLLGQLSQDTRVSYILGCNPSMHDAEVAEILQLCGVDPVSACGKSATFSVHPGPLVLTHKRSGTDLRQECLEAGQHFVRVTHDTEQLQMAFLDTMDFCTPENGQGFSVFPAPDDSWKDLTTCLALRGNGHPVSSKTALSFKDMRLGPLDSMTGWGKDYRPAIDKANADFRRESREEEARVGAGTNPLTPPRKKTKKSADKASSAIGTMAPSAPRVPRSPDGADHSARATPSASGPLPSVEPSWQTVSRGRGNVRGRGRGRGSGRGNGRGRGGFPAAGGRGAEARPVARPGHPLPLPGQPYSPSQIAQIAHQSKATEGKSSTQASTSVIGKVAPWQTVDSKVAFEHFKLVKYGQGQKASGVFLRPGSVKAGLILPLFPSRVGVLTQGEFVYNFEGHILDGTPETGQLVGGKGLCLGFHVKEPREGEQPNCSIHAYGIMLMMDLTATVDAPVELTACRNSHYRGSRSDTQAMEWAARSEQDKCVPDVGHSFIYPRQSVKETVLKHAAKLMERLPPVGTRILSSVLLPGKGLPGAVQAQSIPIPGLGDCALIGPALLAAARVVPSRKKFRKLVCKLFGGEEASGQLSDVEVCTIAERFYFDATSDHVITQDAQLKDLLQRLRNVAADTATKLKGLHPGIMGRPDSEFAQDFQPNLREMGLSCGASMLLALSRLLDSVIEVTSFERQENDLSIHQVVKEYRGADSCQGRILLLHACHDLKAKEFWGECANHFTILAPKGRQLIPTLPLKAQWWKGAVQGKDKGKSPSTVNGLELLMQSAAAATKGKAGLARGVKQPLPKSGPISFLQANPKKEGSKSHQRYELYKFATTVEEAFQLGMKPADLKHDHERNFATVAAAESAPRATAASDASDTEPTGNVGGVPPHQ